MAEADRAVDAYLKGNKEYRKLYKARCEARERYYTLSAARRDELKRRVRRVRNLVWTDGPTPETVAAVKRLLEQVESE